MKLAISSDAMQSQTDMSLDDIIKKKKALKKNTGNKKPGQKGQAGKGRQNNLRGTRGGGVAKRGRPQGQRGGNQFMRPQMKPFNVGGSGKLNITNLDFGVTDADIRELFSEFGPIKNAAIHYGSNGISLGTAHVHFAQPKSASNALNRYNGVHLDGRPMRIALIDGPPRQNAQRGGFGQRLRGGVRNMGNRRPMGGQRGNNKAGQNKQGGRKPMRGAGGKKRGGRGGNQQKSYTADQLDAQLDAYLSQASSK